MDEWKRFANAAVQEELIAQAEALSKKFDLEKPEDMEKAARELHEIQERWKTAAEAPRAQAQTLWHRYRQAADPIQAKAREFFAARAEEREGNLKVKLVLCERAEALADSTDWIKTAEEMKKLQAEWQATGPVPRPDTRVVWKRFRDACDRFFTRRNEDLAQRKEVWSTNQAKKEALCARAEELANSREWERRRLRAAPPPGRLEDRRSGAPHQVRGALAALPHRRRSFLRSLQAARRDRGRIAAGRSRSAAAGARGAAAGRRRRNRPRRRPICSRRSGRCARAGTSPRPRCGTGSDPLSGRFVNTMERLLTTYPDAFKSTELDVEASRQRMEKLVAKLETFVSETDSKPESSQDLAARLREALASNTIGGRAGEESKWRTMAEEVRQAQSSFARLVPVPGETGRQLAERFHKACNRFFDQYRRKVPPKSPAPQRGGGRPVGAR